MQYCFFVKMTKFAVVEFIGENAVSVVPETWIETRDGVSVITDVIYQFDFYWLV